MRMITVLVLVAASSSALAELPDAPASSLVADPAISLVRPIAPIVRPRFNRQEWALVGGVAVAHLGDVVTTRQGLTSWCVTQYKQEYHCMTERELPNFIAGNTPAMTAYSAGMVALQAWGAHKLIEHNHRKLADWSLRFNVVSTGLTAANNHRILVDKRRE